MLALAWTGLARAEDYVVEMSLIYDDPTRPFLWKTNVPDTEISDFQSRPDSAIQPYLTKAKKKLAERQGYSPAIYGEDYWKMIQVQKWFYALQDRSYRVIATNRPQ
jgi:hypothetical protein